MKNEIHLAVGIRKDGRREVVKVGTRGEVALAAQAVKPSAGFVRVTYGTLRGKTRVLCASATTTRVVRVGDAPLAEVAKQEPAAKTKGKPGRKPKNAK